MQKSTTNSGEVSFPYFALIGLLERPKLFSPGPLVTREAHDIIVLGKFGPTFQFELELNRTEHEVQVRGSGNC
jgi:hypothetical protein